MTFDPKSTAVLLIDPYNDFIAEAGKLWPFVMDVATATNTVANMATVTQAARDAGAKVVFVPHHRWVPGDYDGWLRITGSQAGANHMKLCEKDSWGGTFHPDFQVLDGDIVASEHWARSGFANTDLDQQLKLRGIGHVIIVGLLANTCAESMARFAMLLGYEVTLVSDATAAFSAEAMHAAHQINGPTFAHHILTTAEVLDALTPTAGDAQPKESTHA